MTVLEASNKLIEYFANHDYFELSKDFTKLVLVSDTEADKAAIIIALEELAKNQFVIKKDINDHEFWVLYKPLAFQMQEIPVSLMTALQVAETINKYITKDEDKISPMRISEQDIVNLTIIAKRT